LTGIRKTVPFGMSERGFVRKTIAIAATAGLLVTLSACTVSAPSGECTPTVSSGKASEAISATGAINTTPVVDFPTPLLADDTQVTVLSAGDGRVLRDTDYVAFTATGYFGSTGELGLETQAAQVFVDSDGTELSKALECVTEGSRLAVTIPQADTDQTEVYIIDVASSFTSKATGRVEIQQQGFPSIVTAPDGTPGFTIVGDAPSDLRFSTLITGEGENVAEGDLLLVQYSYVRWDTRAPLDSTWGEDGQPAPVFLKAFDPATGLGVSDGVLKALTGKTVGSQVVMVLPPSAFASGSDIALPEAATVVAVYDILGIVDTETD